jgi:hypothetical protein
VSPTTIHVHFARLAAADEVGVEGAVCERHPEGCRARVAAGPHRVYARRAGDHAWGTVEVDAQGGDLLVEAPLDGALTAVSGRLVDKASGAPLAGLRVRVDDSTMRTGPDGRFRLGRLRTGARRLTVEDGAVYGALSLDLQLGGEPTELGDVPVLR